MASPYRALLGTAIPLFLTSITGTIGSIVGLYVLSHHSTATLAAFAVAMAVLTPVSSTVTGAVRGLVPFVAPYRSHPADAAPILRDARWLTLCIGTAGAVAVAAIPWITRLTGVSDDVINQLGTLPWLLALYVLVFAANSGTRAMLISLGRSRQVLWSGLVATGADIVLTVMLVPVMGVEGAGVALVAASASSAVVTHLALRSVPGLGVRSLWPGHPRPAEVLRLARVSIPMAGTVLMKFGVLAVVTYAAASGGTTAAAAHALLNSMVGFLFLIAFSLAQASVPEIARAASTTEVRSINRAALNLGLAGGACGAIVLLGFGDPLFRLFSPDDGVRALALSLVPLLIAAVLADSGGAVMGFSLTGLKRSGWNVTSFALSYGLLAAAAYPATYLCGLPGLWGMIVLSNTLLAVLQGAGFWLFSRRISVETEPERARTKS